MVRQPFSETTFFSRPIWLLSVLISAHSCGGTSKFASAGAPASSSSKEANSSTASTKPTETAIPPQTPVPLPTTTAALDSCKIKGKVVSAVDNSFVAGATITIDTTPQQRIVTGVDGLFSFEKLPSGYINITTTAAGYSADTSKAKLEPCEDAEIVIALSPDLAPGQMRIVLTWGAKPADLDSHLIGPATGGAFHVWFNNRVTADRLVNLDVDDTDSYGPETITIKSLTAGHYEYDVVDYSNLTPTGMNTTPAMSNSMARVKFFRAGAPVQEFNITPGIAGIVWQVFTFDVDASGKVTVNSVDVIGTVVKITLRGG